MFSTAEAILCGNYTPLGQVQIGPLDSLAGQLVPFQIPDNIISTLKLADLAVTAAKLGIGSVSDSKVAAAAAILESKLNLDFSTSDLNADIQTRALLATYLAHNHSIADPTQVDHANLINVLANQHHPQSHTLGSHSTKDHSELTNVLTSQHHVKTSTIGELSDHNKANHDSLGLDHSSLSNVLTSQHHVKYTNVEAIAAVEGESTINLKVIEADGNVYPKTSGTRDLGTSLLQWKKVYTSDFGIQLGADVTIYRGAANQVKTDDDIYAGGNFIWKGITINFNDIYDLLTYGASNQDWIACIPFWYSDLVSTGGGLYDFVNLGATDITIAMQLPLPMTKAGKKLYIDCLRTVVFLADATDYIDRVRVYGVAEDSLISIIDEQTNRTTKGTYDSPPVTDHDCSEYTSVRVIVNTVCATVSQLQLVNILVRYYYA